MRQAKENWIPCTSMFPDYEICLGPFIAIRRTNTRRGSFTGKRIAIQHYKNEFWTTLYTRHGEAKRVNITDMARWASATEWKRKGGKSKPKAESEPVSVPGAERKSVPVAPPEPPKPATREQLLRRIKDVERSEYADFVKRREIRELQQKLCGAGWRG